MNNNVVIGLIVILAVLAVVYTCMNQDEEGFWGGYYGYPYYSYSPFYSSFRRFPYYGYGGWYHNLFYPSYWTGLWY